MVGIVPPPIQVVTSIVLPCRPPKARAVVLCARSDRRGVVPLPLTDIIEEELLATLDGDGDPQAVLDRHAGSKGPLYAALARATAEATVRFGEVRGKLRDAQSRRQATEAQAKDAEKRATEAGRRAASAEKRLASAGVALQKRQALLDRAAALQAAGFDAAALGRLSDALTDAAQAEGKPIAEVVAAFLEAAGNWRRLAELRGQVADAEKAGKEADRQARRQQAEAKLSDRAVKAGGWLIQNKVTVPTVEAWQTAATKAGLTAETLATGLARALEQHGTLEATRQTWAGAVAQLRVEHGKLTQEVAALQAERDGITAAIASVRKHGIAEIRSVADETAAEVQRAASEFEQLTARSAELGQHVRMAEALRSEDPADWRAVRAGTWAEILSHLPAWAAARDATAVEIQPHPNTRLRVEEQAKYPTLHGPVRLTLPELVEWVEEGIRVQARRQDAGRAD